MSYVFPGEKFKNAGTQPIELSLILNSIDEWAKNYGEGVSGAPTYKANNNTAAYFKFMAIQDNKLDIHEFVTNPDQPKFNDVRKFMIVLANILMSEFNEGFDLGARQIDYNQICAEADQNALQLAFGKWAKEIDPSNSDYFTEIYAVVEGTNYPIAFYSDSKLRVYPRNMINKTVTTKFFGWDSHPAEGLNEYTMRAFKASLDQMPPGPRILYAVLVNASSKFQGIKCVEALSSWLARNYQVVIPETGLPVPLAGSPKPLIVEGTAINLNIPRYAPPYGIGTDACPIFSDKLLIIKSNKNVEDGKFGFCKVDGMSIGRAKGEKFAIVPPISDTLISIMHNNPTSVRFEGCSIEASSGGSYKANMTLNINGAQYVHTNIYLPGNVNKCNNFPLITVLSAGTNQNPFPATLYRCNYPKAMNVPQSYIDGSAENFTLGDPGNISSNGFELEFGKTLPFSNQGEFRYLGVRYHDNAAAASTISFGYLFFADQNSLFDEAANASSTAAIIDDENNVAKIAVWNSGNNTINDYDVYNDKIMFITHNGRRDFNYNTRQVWGIPDETIFSLENGKKYAIAPFSLEFSKMIAESKISIKNAVLQPNGNKWEFQVAFTDSRQISQKAPVKVYSVEDQYTCTNAPFIWAVSTLDDRANEGYEIVLVQNMNPTITGENIIDSNKLTFKMDRNELNPSTFIKGRDVEGNPINRAYVQVYGGMDKSIFYGQIGLPLDKYTWSTGFNPDLQDSETGCAAVLLVNSTGPNSPKQIITGRVFDDNLLFIQKEESRKTSPEYQAWRASGLFVDITNIPEHFSDKKCYEAIFPFSFKMLQNLKNEYLALDFASVSGKPKIEYDEVKKAYHVSVSIQSGGTVIPCEMYYSEDKILKCDNLPFIVSLENARANICSLVRFDNNISSQGSNPHAFDGSLMSIEYIDDNNEAFSIYKSSVGVNENARFEPISSENAILRFNIDGTLCHVLYKAKPSAFKEGVYAVQSDITGVQHIFDFSIVNGVTVVKEINVFTDYVMYTTTMAGQFANNANCINLGKHGGNEYRMYSIPITMEFSSLMEKRGIDIASYNDVKYYTDPTKPDNGIIDDEMLGGLYVEISLTGIGFLKIVKHFPAKNILRFERHPLPTLTVFPFVNFIADESYGPEMVGKNLWNEYSYARFMPKNETPSESVEQRVGSSGEPLGSRVEFWINGRMVNFARRNTCIMEKNEDPAKTIMEIAKVNGWGNYIHMKYDGSSRLAAAQPVDAQWNGQELGCIMMKPAVPNKVSKNELAEVGVDFGTRNSIIAIQPRTQNDPAFPYPGNNEMVSLQKTIIPCMSSANFEEFSNLSYIPHFESRSEMPRGQGKFSSTVMLYSDAMNAINLELMPYDTGFIPNVKGDVLNKLMEKLNESGTMGDVLGFYSDLKICNSEDRRRGYEIMQRNVELFIRSLMFHIVLNSYMKCCGKINIRISLPSEQFVSSMKDVWTKAKEYIDNVFPVQARGNITIGEYATEADALFKYLQDKDVRNNISRFSAITDGGDGTYDFTINEINPQTRKMSQRDSFSLRYAGKQIMTDSVNAFYDHLVSCNGRHDDNVRSKFKGLWNSTNKNATEIENLDKLVKQVEKYHIDGSKDYEGEKAVVLMLIEQFGIDCNRLINFNAKGLTDTVVPMYQNFVRMIQYKFLFLFNVLGEQIRNSIQFDKYTEQSFTIFLYGGTAQALALIEPACRGNIQLYAGEKGYNLLMVNYINALMAFPKNCYNQDVFVKFIPAADSEKREIASGLIMMDFDEKSLKNFNDVESMSVPTFENAFNNNDNNNAGSGGAFGFPSAGGFGAFPSAGAPGGFPSAGAPGGFPPAGGFGAFPSAGAPGGFPTAGTGAGPASSEDSAIDDLNKWYPQDIDSFVKNIKNTILNRTVRNADSIDSYLPFLDKQGKPILLSQILDNEGVRRDMTMKMSTIWGNVIAENTSIISRPKLIYDIFTLKMVGYAIETYLKS